MFNTEKFQELLEPTHRKIIFDTYKEIKPIYQKYFDVENMDKEEISYPHLGALSRWVEGVEGSAISLQELTEGDTASFKAKRFTNGYKVTYELAKDDLYGVFERGRGLGGNAKELARTVRVTEEVEAANILNNGFSATYAIYDGKALFATDHPLVDTDAVTGSNLIAGGALTDTTLQNAIINLETQVNEAGDPIFTEANMLVVAPANKFNAMRLVNSILQPGNANNDVNVTPNLEVVSNRYLTSTTAFFVMDKNVENLKFFWRDKPRFWAEKIQNTVDMQMNGYARFIAGAIDWRGITASTGA